MRTALLLAFALGACRRGPEVKPDEARTKPRVTCTLPDEGSAVVDVPGRCDLAIAKSRTVRTGQRFLIGPGAHLTFASGASLVVAGGSLVARGTRDEPIVLTATDDSSGLSFEPENGDAGVADAATAPESTVEHAILERASLTVRGVSPRLKLADIAFRASPGPALRIAYEASLVGATRLSFEGTAIAIDAPPAAVARITDSTLKERVQLHGEVTGAVRLPPVAAGYLAESLHVRDGSLTFPDGAVVRMSKGAELRAIATKATPASFHAKNVTFTSAALPPAPGDWRGFMLHASPTKLDGCTIEYAGSDPKAPEGAVHFLFDDKGTVISGTTFRNNVSYGIEAATSCATFDDKASGNTSVGKALCAVTSPFGVIGLLGSFGGDAGSLGSVFGTGGLGLSGTGGLGGAEFGDGIGLGKIGTAGGTSGLPEGSGVGGGGGKAMSKARVIERSATVSAGLPPEVVKRISRANTSRYRACYDSALSSKPGLTGTISVKFTIDKAGAVSGASATGGTLTDPSTVTCVVSVISSLSFPEPEGAAVNVTMMHEYLPE